MKICDVAKRSWSGRGVDIHKTDGTEFSAVRERRTPHDGDTVRCRSDEQGVESIPLRRLRPHWRRENVTGNALVCRGTATRRGERLCGRGCLPSSVATPHVVHDERSLLGHQRHAAPAPGGCRAAAQVTYITLGCSPLLSPQ